MFLSLYAVEFMAHKLWVNRLGFKFGFEHTAHTTTFAKFQFHHSNVLIGLSQFFDHYKVFRYYVRVHSN